MNIIKKLFLLSLGIICLGSCKREADVLPVEELGVPSLYVNGIFNDTITFYHSVGAYIDDDSLTTVRASSSKNAPRNTSGVWANLEIGWNNFYGNISDWTTGIEISFSGIHDSIPFSTLVNPSNNYNYLYVGKEDSIGVTIGVIHHNVIYTSQRAENENAYFRVTRVQNFQNEIYCSKKVDVEFSCKLRKRYDDSDTTTYTLQSVGSFLFMDNWDYNPDCQTNTEI